MLYPAVDHGRWLEGWFINGGKFDIRRLSGRLVRNSWLLIEASVGREVDPRIGKGLWLESGW